MWQTTSNNCALVHAARVARWFYSFNQSYHCFLASSLSLPSYLLKLPIHSAWRGVSFAILLLWQFECYQLLWCTKLSLQKAGWFMLDFFPPARATHHGFKLWKLKTRNSQNIWKVSCCNSCAFINYQASQTSRLGLAQHCKHKQICQGHITEKWNEQLTDTENDFVWVISYVR